MQPLSPLSVNTSLSSFVSSETNTPSQSPTVLPFQSPLFCTRMKKAKNPPTESAQPADFSPQLSSEFSNRLITMPISQSNVELGIPDSPIFNQIDRLNAKLKQEREENKTKQDEINALKLQLDQKTKTISDQSKILTPLIMFNQNLLAMNKESFGDLNKSKLFIQAILGNLEIMTQLTDEKVKKIAKFMLNFARLYSNSLSLPLPSSMVKDNFPVGLTREMEITFQSLFSSIESQSVQAGSALSAVASSNPSLPGEHSPFASSAFLLSPLSSQSFPASTGEPPHKKPKTKDDKEIE